MSTNYPPPTPKSEALNEPPIGIPLNQLVRSTSYIAFILFAFVISIALYNPMFSVELFALRNAHVSQTLGGYLLAILNVSSIFGRLFFNRLADRYGVFEIYIPCIAAAGKLTFGCSSAHCGSWIDTKENRCSRLCDDEVHKHRVHNYLLYFVRRSFSISPFLVCWSTESLKIWYILWLRYVFVCLSRIFSSGTDKMALHVSGITLLSRSARSGSGRNPLGATPRSGLGSSGDRQPRRNPHRRCSSG